MIKYDFLWDKLPIFFENFNSQLSKLSFFKLEAQVMSDLFKIVSWLENANRALFHHFDTKAVLYIAENIYEEVDVGTYEQKRRSFPLESLFFLNFPDMYKQLVAYVRQKLIDHKSEFRLVIVFKGYNKNKNQMTRLRIETMEQERGKTLYQSSVSKQ